MPAARAAASTSLLMSQPREYRVTGIGVDVGYLLCRAGFFMRLMPVRFHDSLVPRGRSIGIRYFADETFLIESNYGTI